MPSNLVILNESSGFVKVWEFVTNHLPISSQEVLCPRDIQTNIQSYFAVLAELFSYTFTY
jgi:hypothetical protein